MASAPYLPWAPLHLARAHLHSSPGLTQAHLPQLSPLLSLQSLDLSFNLMTIVDEGLAALRGLRELRLGGNRM